MSDSEDESGTGGEYMSGETGSGSEFASSPSRTTSHTSQAGSYTTDKRNSETPSYSNPNSKRNSASTVKSGASSDPRRVSTQDSSPSRTSRRESQIPSPRKPSVSYKDEDAADRSRRKSSVSPRKQSTVVESTESAQYTSTMASESKDTRTYSSMGTESKETRSDFNRTETCSLRSSGSMTSDKYKPFAVQIRDSATEKPTTAVPCSAQQDTCTIRRETVDYDSQVQNLDEQLDALTDQVRNKPPETTKVETKPTRGALLRHMAAVGECYRQLYTHDQLCDVIIHIDCSTFSGHKALLMAHSDYFHQVLIDTDRHVQTEIHVTGIPSPAFQLIMEFMYTSDVVLTMDNIADVYTTAQQLGIPTLLDKCALLLQDLDGSPLKALTILDQSTSKESEIFHQAFNCVVTHFVDVVETPSLASQQVEIVLSLLEVDQLVVNNEMDVFTAALLWIRRDPDERMTHVEKLFERVRFWHMTPQQLLTSLELMQKYTVMKSNPVMLDAMWYAICRTHTRPCLFDFDPPLRRRYRDTMEAPVVIGMAQQATPVPSENTLVESQAQPPTDEDETAADGKAGGKKKQTGANFSKDDYYKGSPQNLDTDRAKDIAPFHLSANHIGSGGEESIEGEEKKRRKSRRSSRKRRESGRDDDSIGLPGIVEDSDETKDQSLLILGGRSADPCFNAEDVGKSVFSFHPASNTWHKVTEIPEPRHLHAVALLVDCVYIVGGSRPLDQYERYPIPSAVCFQWNLRTHKWTQVASMNNRRIHHGACVLYHRLYAIAGQNECAKVLNSVEVYNPVLDQWDEVAPLSVSRIGMGVTTYEGMIMVAGGYHDICTNTSSKHVVGTVEIYQPSTNTWTLLSDLPYPRCHGGLVNVGGELFFTAGATRMEYNKQKFTGVASISNVDKYNPSLDKWEKFTNMGHKRHGGPVCPTADSKLYIVGGVSSIEQGAVNNIECLDIVTGTISTYDLECPADMGMGVVACATALVTEIEYSLERRKTVHGELIKAKNHKLGKSSSITR